MSSIYEDKANLKTLAIAVITIEIMLAIVLSGYNYAVQIYGNEQNYVGQGLNTIYDNTIGKTGVHNFNNIVTKRTITNVTCPTTDPLCGTGLQSTTSITNTGFDPKEEQTNWGKVARSIFEVFAIVALPITYLPTLQYLAGSLTIVSAIISLVVLIWQIITAWAIIKLLRG